MTSHIRDDSTITIAPDGSPAGRPLSAPEEHARADATPAAPDSPESSDRVAEKPGQSRWRRGRVLIGLTVAAGVVVSGVLPSGGSAAFASWSPTPQRLVGAAAASAASTCRVLFEMQGQGGRVLIAERRGGWTYVLMTDTGVEAACLMPDDFMEPGAHPSGSDGGFFGEFITDPAPDPTVGRDRIDQIQYTGGRVETPGRVPFTTDAQWVSWVSGYIGSDVVGVTVHPPVGPDVEATVDGNRFAAWWPAGEVRGDNPGVSGASTYTITLADGTTRASAGESAPSMSP